MATNTKNGGTRANASHAAPLATDGGAALLAADQSSIVRDLAEELRALYDAELTMLTGPEAPSVPVAILPQGKMVVGVKSLLDEWRAVPERRRGTAQLQDLESLVEWVNRHKDADSACFALRSLTAPKIVAVIDYHRAGEPGAGRPRWGEHRAEYQFPLSTEWQAWLRSNEQWMDQAGFASWLEERVVDVIQINDQADEDLAHYAQLVGGAWASPTKLVELSRGLAINVDTAVRSAVTTSSGEVEVSYAETHKDGTGHPVRVPSLFAIAIPVWFNGALYRIPVRLRYRVHQGKLAWSYALVRPDRTFEDAFAGACEQVRRETALPVFIGTPDSAR